MTNDTLRRLRMRFESGRTRPLAWRRQQLAAIERMLIERKAEFEEALRLDLNKSPFETWLSETSYVIEEAKYARRHLARWMRGERVRTPMVAQPGRSRILPEPKGVVLIIAPWNYPLQLAARAAGGRAGGGQRGGRQAVGGLARHLGRARAGSCRSTSTPRPIAVVEGGVEETTELLEQRFDHILYTGNERVARIVHGRGGEAPDPRDARAGRQEPLPRRPRCGPRGRGAAASPGGSSSTPGRPASRPTTCWCTARSQRRCSTRSRAASGSSSARMPRRARTTAASSNERHAARLRAAAGGPEDRTSAGAWTWPRASSSPRSCSIRRPTRR